MKKVFAVAAAMLAMVLATSAVGADSPLTVESQTSSTITFRYATVAGAGGYRYYADGKAVSRTFDPSRSTVKFAKGSSSYRVSVLDVSERPDGFVYPPVVQPAGCDLAATPSTFAAQVSAATAGQTVCLAAGNYGTWGGTSKAITVKAASGASPQMKVSLGSGDSGFTLDGMTGMGGEINGASNVTIRNSAFTSTVDLDGPNVNVVLDGNTHNWNTSRTTGPNAKIGLGGGRGTVASPSVTIRNTEIANGDLDGVFIGGGSGYLIENNTFKNLCDAGVNHTDQIQFADTSPAVTQTRIAGNFINSPCGTQGITSFDHGTNGVLIENNVVDVHRPWGIELYSDVNSVVRHNTVVYHPAAECDFGQPCGKIGTDHKSGDPIGVGTQVYDNLAVADLDSSGATAHHNASSQGAVYVGPLTSHDGFLLAPSSPTGRGAASDGKDVGVYR